MFTVRGTVRVRYSRRERAYGHTRAFLSLRVVSHCIISARAHYQYRLISRLFCRRELYTRDDTTSTTAGER